jgi:hypothetical protein
VFRAAFRRSVIATAFAAVASVTLAPRSSLAQRSSPDQTPPAPPSAQPSQRPLNPSSGHLSRSPLRFALPRRAYLCDGNVRVVILVETKAARLTLNDHIYNMKQVETASGTKYAEGSVVWSANGPDGSEVGFLEDDSVPSKPQMLAVN